MGGYDHLRRRVPTLCTAVFVLLLAPRTTGGGADIFLEWNVASNLAIRPVSSRQPVITINGMFPGPLINATVDDVIHVNIFNSLDEPILMTWNGIQGVDSWQDGVSGTNCPIQPGTNWTYEFQVKRRQVGSFFYFLSTNFHKVAGGYGPIRINDDGMIPQPFPTPEGEFDLLVGDWYFFPFKFARDLAAYTKNGFGRPKCFLINGKAPYDNLWGGAHETLEVQKGKMYRLRISNVGSAVSFNFRIQNHFMILVEAEGSYTEQIELDSLDVHVGQSYSVLVTMDQLESDYYMVATPTHADALKYSGVNSVAILRYSNSNSPPAGPLPAGPHPSDRDFSIQQAKNVRYRNMRTGAAAAAAAGPVVVDPQMGAILMSVDVESIFAISRTLILHSSRVTIGSIPRHAVNNVSYMAPETPLKLADYFLGGHGGGVYQLDAFPVDSVSPEAVLATSVVNGTYKGWLEIVFQNNLEAMDSWHLDGVRLYVVGFGNGEWGPDSREFYNVWDPLVRSTVQVYPGGWTAVLTYLDNPGMWNLRSQKLENWYLGQELYIRVHDPNPDKERPPPHNLLLCGIFARPIPETPTMPSAPSEETESAPPPGCPSAPSPSPGGAPGAPAPSPPKYC